MEVVFTSPLYRFHVNILLPAVPTASVWYSGPVFGGPLPFGTEDFGEVLEFTAIRVRVDKSDGHGFFDSNILLVTLIQYQKVEAARVLLEF